MHTGMNGKSRTRALRPPTNDEEKWKSVLAKDAAADGAFVYGVRSTGIYCRPTCGARRPASPAAVEFFTSSDDAEAAGYRACLRCCPDSDALWQRDLIRVQRACRIVEQKSSGHNSGVTLQALADELGDISSFHLQKSFKQILGISPRQYLDAVRLRNFRAMLQDEKPVSAAARDAGLRASATLYGRESMQLGVTPSQYRAGAYGLEIDYAVLPCPLGYLLLAATSRGVCAIKLGNSPAELVESLSAEFRHSTFRAGSNDLSPYLLAALSAMGEDNHASVAVQRLPLDIRATAFQWRVWLALRRVSPGKTITYSELAAAINSPTSARAVGTACGANPVALAIPCHRAVGSNGSLTGYRWGIDRKKRLLDQEKCKAR